MSQCPKIKLPPEYLLKASDLCTVSILAHHSINYSEVGKDPHTWHAQNRNIRKMQVSPAHGIILLLLELFWGKKREWPRLVIRKLLGIDPVSSSGTKETICEGFSPPRNIPALSTPIKFLKKKRTDQTTAQGIAAVQHDKDINLRWLCAAPVLEYYEG